MLEFNNNEAQQNERVPAAGLLMERESSELTARLLQQPDFMEALYREAADPKSWIANLTDLQSMKAIMDRLTEELANQIGQMNALAVLSLSAASQTAQLESAASLTIRTLDKLLERWQRRISDGVMTKLLVKLVIYATTNRLVAEVLLLISHYLFSIEDKALFYVVRAYMEHWNSYNNKRIGLDSLLQVENRGLRMEFAENGQSQLIEASYEDLKQKQESGLSLFEIASALCKEHDNLHIFLAVVVKLRFVLCTPEQLSDLVYCVLLSFQVVNRIEVSWFRTEETRKQIPEIFIFPPDYENIFLEFLELLSLKECDSRTHLHILEVIKAILEVEQQAEEGSDLFMSLAEHFTYIRRIVNDINNSLQGKPPHHLPVSTVSDKQFVKVVLQLLCLCNVEIEDIMEVSFEVAERVAFSEDFDRETVAVACLVLTYQQLNDIKEEHLIDRLMQATCQGTSPHITSYLFTLSSFFGHINHYGQAHRRDSTAVARKLVESPMFENLSKMITLEPLRVDSIAYRTLTLIENICSEAPLLTTKLSTIIDQLLEVLRHSKNYPEEPESLVTIPSFLHHISLKEGDIREKVMTSGVLEAMIGVYALDKFTKVLSLTNHAEQIAQFFGSINRFLVNLPACKDGILRGLLAASRTITDEMLWFEKEFDQQLEGKAVVRTVRYEDAAAKINNFMRLVIKIGGNLSCDCTELYNQIEVMFKLKYLNVHNPAENYWMIHNAKLMEDSAQPLAKLEAISADINRIAAETSLELYDPKVSAKLVENINSPSFNEAEHRNWRICVNLNRLDRLINLARTSLHPEALYNRIDLFPWIEKLDMMRSADSTSILEDLNDLQAPLNNGELRDFLLHTLKALAQKKNNIGLILQHTLKRLLNEACKARSFVTNQRITASVTTLLEKFPSPESTLHSVYLTKLKLDHLQFMLEMIPMVLHNYSQFPCNFTTFCYLYQENPEQLFTMFAALLGNYWQEVKEPEGNVRNFTEMLRNEVLKKVVIVLQSISNFEMLEDEDDDPQEDEEVERTYQERAGCIRFVIARLLKGFIQLATMIPSTSDCSSSSEVGIKHVLVTIFSTITRLASARTQAVSKCKLAFPIDPAKSLTETEFKVESEVLFNQFQALLLEKLPTWQFYQLPMLGMYLHSNRKLFKWKEAVRTLYKKACEGAIEVAKSLFLDYSIDLGIRHPKVGVIDYATVDLRNELNRFNIYLTSVAYVMEVATHNKWFGMGELIVPSTTICELVKLTEHIINNSSDLAKEQTKPLLAIDPMVKRVLVLVETYRAYEAERRAEAARQKKKDSHGKELIKLEPIRARKRCNRKKKAQKLTEGTQVAEKKEKIKETGKKQEEQGSNLPRVRTKRPRHKTHRKPSQLSVSVQSMLHSLLSQPLPMIESGTLRQVMLLLSDSLKGETKKLLRIRMDELAPLIVQARIKDSNRSGLIDDLSTYVIRLFSSQHIRLDVEAAIKRIFFEIDKDAKDGWLPLTQVLNQVKMLSESFKEEDVATQLRALCSFRKDTEEVTFTNRQLWENIDHSMSQYEVRLRPGVDLTTISMPELTGLKNKRKGSHKEHPIGSTEEPNKYVDYVPDGPLLAALRTILEQMIANIVQFIDYCTTNRELQSLHAFDFNSLAKVLRIVVRESSILIPFITRFKCRKTINTCLVGCSESTRRIVEELLAKRDKENREPGEITFMSLLLRLFTTVSFKNLERLIFLLCLDNYVLCRSPKNVVQPIGYWIRMKVLEELAGGGCGWIRNLAYLNLLMNLLDIKEFSRQCIQEGTIAFLHRQFITTRQQKSTDFFFAQLPCIINPLTVLHNVNLSFQVSKQKPIVVRGKHTASQVKHQLIGKSFLRKNNFTRNWIYQSSDEIVRADYTRQFRRDGNGEFDDENLFFNSDDGTEEYEGSEALSQAEQSEEPSGSGQGDEIELEQDEIEGDDLSSDNGWTSEHHVEGFDVGDEDDEQLSSSHNDMEQEHIIEEEIEQEEGSYDSDEMEGLSDQPSSIIIEQVYGNDNTSQSESNAHEHIFSDLQGNPKIFNPEVRRLAEQIEQVLLSVFVRKDEENPIYQKVRSEELFQLCESVEKWLMPGERATSDGRKTNTINSLIVELKDPKVIYDDINVVLPPRWRRRGQFMQRPRMITASSVQVDNQEGPVVIDPEGPPAEVAHHQPRQLVEDDVIENEMEEGNEEDEEEVEGQINDMGNFHARFQLLLQGEPEENEPTANLGNIDELLRGTNLDPNEFRLLPREVQADILHNIMNPGVQEIHRILNNEIEGEPGGVPENEHEEMRSNSANQPQPMIEQAPVEEPPHQQPNPEDVVYDRRRKLSHDYIRKIAKDPREILLKEKKEQKLYLCENEFISALLSLLYQDQVAHNDFPFALLKSLCANPLNETRFLSVFMILLKHPNLQQEKQAHGESLTTFPMTVLRQKNGELATDYLNMGYSFLSIKIMHILSILSRTNSQAMLQSTHNKVVFLPQWYWIEEKPYYAQLIELLDQPAYRELSLRTYLTETIFNIIRHYCLKFIHEREQGSTTQEFRLKLSPKEVRLLCCLLESSEETEHISEVIMLLCINEDNLTTFISTLNVILEGISRDLIADLRSHSTDDKFMRGHLKRILSIVYDMFQSEYTARLEKSQSRSTVHNELLRSFKSLIECRSLQQLCHEWIEYMCDNTVSHYQLAILTEVLECFFIIYRITMVEEQHKSKRRNISALGDLEHTDSRKSEQPTQEFSLETEFSYICQRGRPIVNNILKQKLSDMKKMRRKEMPPSIFDDPMIYILSRSAGLLDYDNKRTMFKMEIKNLKAREKSHQTIEMLLSREHVLDQSLNEIMARSASELKGKLHIQFQDEEGEDAGGLTREWFSLLSREMFNPNYAIFQPSSTGNTYQPSPKSYINPHHLTYFKFVGRVVGKAMHDGFIMEAFFTPAFYKHILGLPITYRDMEEEDYEFYKNMVWIAENNITDVLELTFSYDYDDFGQLKVRDLKPDGRNIPVTQENKMEYIQLLCYAKMATAVQKQIEAFLEGFHELVPSHLVTIFDSKELELMISGLPTIDIQDLRQHTDLVNYDKHDNVIVWLFEVLESFDANLRASFLQFVTGTSRLPSDGFKGLRGVNGPQKFNIHKDFDSSKLPRAHTCFNQLDLPNYPSKEVLVEKLTVAITEGKEGFGMI